MDEYIKREAVIERIRRMPRCVNPDLVQYSLVKGIIAETPDENVVPIVHEFWIEKQGIVLRFCLDKWLECSNCQSRNETMIKFNYCPNCGAKMDR